MPDHLYLSLWVEGHSALALPTTFKKALEEFPFSRLRPSATLRVYALEFSEAPLLEAVYDIIPDAGGLVDAAREFIHEDVAFQLDAFWELWQWDGDWSLKPSPVSIEVYAPEFASDLGEDIRLDLGLETLYLPPEDSGILRPLQSNIRSVLHLEKDLEAAFKVRKKSLWSEEGENFAERLEELLND